MINFPTWIKKAGGLLCLWGLLAALSGCGGPGTPNASSIPTETTAAETVPQAASAETTANSFTGTGYCTADSMHVRGGPGTGYIPIGGLKYGETVQILGKDGDWYKIAFKEDVGYVSAQYIQSSPPPAGTSEALRGEITAGILRVS